MPTELTAKTQHGGARVIGITAMADTDVDDDQDRGARFGNSERLEPALSAARDLLAGTVGKIHPGTSPRRLFTYVTQYRARLAELVAACSAPASGDSA